MAIARRIGRKLGTYRRKRDFSRSAEPSGRGLAPAGPHALRFVVQKHAASHLHFDLRLELDGVMKSWAVPKGPSFDPATKRLAIEVEDHPMEYNAFEGVIPAGEYGGGTVMLWDRGTYTVDDAQRGDDEAAARRGYEQGKLAVTFHGERLRGSFALVRTRTAAGPATNGTKPQWLLIKHRDAFATTGARRGAVGEPASADDRSVATGRTMDEISGQKTAVWRSNGSGTAAAAGRSSSRANARRSLSPTAISPMLAVAATEPPVGDDWVYEPKYDGVRLLAFVAQAPGGVQLVSRNGNEKTQQFPEIVEALREVAAKEGRAFVVDGEVVALDSHGAPARFQALQSRTHLSDRGSVAARRSTAPVAHIVFDLLLDGDDVLLTEPWHVRHQRLLRLLHVPPRRRPRVLRVSETLSGDPSSLLAAARAAGSEGVIAKRASAPYRPGRRVRDWIKVKVEHQQELVVGGFTDPRNSREHLGAILLGYYDPDGALHYAGHTGGGFSRDSLRDMARRLEPLERATSPFAGPPPRTNERPHWVRPKVVVEVKFNEWTSDGKLRQPIFLGIRDDKDPREVVREPLARPPGRRKSKSHEARARAPRPPRATARTPSSSHAVRSKRSASASSRLLSQLDEIEHSGGSGVLTLAKGTELEVSNLDKIFFPKTRHTKGDLMRYYARIAPYLLRAIADRPLVMKRFPNGVGGEAFYQQKAPREAPSIVRVEAVSDEGLTTERRLVGGDLPTLLYTVQLGAISVDPWHSRVQSVRYADYSIIDLDPGPRARFARVMDVAGWVKEELDDLGLHAVLKTSGASGIHIVLPLSAGITNTDAQLVAQLVATRVADKHPREATVQRSVRSRAAAAVYVDYLQNIRGKTVAAVYSARAQPQPTVSAPLRWDELVPDLDPRDFTIQNVPERVAKLGDLWAAGMRRKNKIGPLLNRAREG